MARTCEHCGILDALDRHAPDCSYALQIGLPRLAEGEEPIDPDDGIDLEDAAAEEAERQEKMVALREDRDPLPPPAPDAEPRRVLGVGNSANPDAGLYTGLWMSWTVDDSGYFDAIIFASEIEALRYAVKHRYTVVPLELGKPLREHTDSQ